MRARSLRLFLLAFLVLTGCDQFRDLRASNSDERRGPDDRFDDQPVPDPTWLGPDPSPPEPVLSCWSSERLCDGVCVDVIDSVEHCGSCDIVCPTGMKCWLGQCQCPYERIHCGDVCTVPLEGACGPCGDQCPAELGCQDSDSHAADWPTLGADMRRSGYNQGELGTPPLTEEWAVSLSRSALRPVVIEGSRVFAAVGGGFQATGPVIALAIDTGEQLWTHDLGRVFSLGQPTVVDCRVYVPQSQGFDEDARLWALDATTGEAIWASTFDAQFYSYWAPTVTSESIYANCGTYGGLCGFRRANGLPMFTAGLEQYDEWAAALYDGEVYSFVEGRLRRHDPTTGMIRDTVSVPWDWVGWSMATSPVFSPDGTVYVIAPPTLYAIEAETKRTLWQYTADASGMPALAEGLVLVITGQRLSALDAATGAVIWTAVDTEGLLNAPVAAHGFAYAASDSATYAIDLKTGDVVWQAEVGGWLSIGGGRLFVADAKGTLHSYQLSVAPSAP